MNKIFFCRLKKVIYRRKNFIGWHIIKSIIILEPDMKETNNFVMWPFDSMPRKKKLKYPSSSLLERLLSFENKNKTTKFRGGQNKLFGSSMKLTATPFPRYRGTINKEELEDNIESIYPLFVSDRVFNILKGSNK